MTHAGYVQPAALPGRHWDRFWEKVTPTGFCWEWAGSPDPAGYGSYSLAGRAVRSHRVAYELLVGPIPDGLVLDHLCRNRGCVNPDHLEPVTQGENARRGLVGLKRKTHCIRGHRLSDENTYKHRPGNGRPCKQCARDKQRRLYHQRKTDLSGRTPA